MTFLDDLKGKAVLVTGASTGIGAAVARGFGACSADVAVHYNRNRGPAEAVATDIRATGARAELFGADIADTAAVATLIADVVAAFGRLDVLINNAGGLIQRTPAEEMTDALFTDIVDLNVRSVVMACREALPQFRKQGHGNTRHLAKTYAHLNIRVNAVAPGVIMTPFHAETPRSAVEAWEKTIPMGRLGAPDDLVGAYLFLASDRMSGYVTGQVVDVNGGYFMVP